jgi:guanidinopropionase
MRVMFVEEVQKRGVDAIIEETRNIVGDTPVYLSFDIDSIDPAFAPGTGTPEIAGLTTPEAMALIRGFRNLNYIGADMVEVSPPFDVGGVTSLTGATVMYELLCLLAESVSAR